MDDKVNYGIVGAFVIILGAALIVAVLWLATGLSGKKSYVPYQTVVIESVAGLNVDAPVKYLGVDVGKVSKIAIDTDSPQQVRIRLQIERGTPIRQDTEAVLKTQGLTGIAFVELSGGSVDSPLLTSAGDDTVPMIRSKPSLSARLEDVLTNVLANLDRTSANLNALFDADNRTAVKSVLADTALLARSLAQQHDPIAQGIADAARTAHNSVQASAQLSTMLAKLAPNLALVAPILDQINRSAQGFDAMTGAAGQSLRSLERTADQAARGVQQLNIETLPGIDRFLNELNELTPTLRRLAEQLERNPNSVLLGGATRSSGPGEAVRK